MLGRPSATELRSPAQPLSPPLPHSSPLLPPYSFFCSPSLLPPCCGLSWTCRAAQAGLKLLAPSHFIILSAELQVCTTMSALLFFNVIFKRRLINGQMKKMLKAKWNFKAEKNEIWKRPRKPQSVSVAVTLQTWEGCAHSVHLEDRGHPWRRCSFPQGQRASELRPATARGLSDCSHESWLTC